MTFLTLTSYFPSIPEIKLLQHEASLIQRVTYNRCVKDKWNGKNKKYYENELSKEFKVLLGIEKLEAFSILSQVKRGTALYLSWLERENKRKYNKEKGLGIKNKITFGGVKNFQKYLNREITKQEFKENRLVPVFIEGESTYDSNRRFEFNFENNTVRYYVWRRNTTKRKIEFYDLPLGLQKKNIKLIKKALYHKLPISISLSHNKISFSFDLDKLPLEKPYKPIIGRTLAFDSNPSNLGYSITDKHNKVIYSGYYITPIEGYKKEPKKRKYWLSKVIKELSIIAKHYKVEKIVAEDLDNLRYKYSNYWSKKKIVIGLQKHCSLIGIKHITVNPAFSSKIGNMLHGTEYGDAVGASIELNRRGKYDPAIKGNKEPSIFPSWGPNSLTGQWKILSSSKTPISWKRYFGLIKNSSLYSARVKMRDATHPYILKTFVSYQSGIQKLL